MGVLIKMNEINGTPVTGKYTKEELDSHGISLIYLVNPSTFCPFVKIFNNNDVIWSAMKEFNRTDDVDVVNDFIDKTADEIIYKNRSVKIKKIKRTYDNKRI